MRIILAGPPKTGNVWVKHILREIYGLKGLPPEHEPKETIDSLKSIVADGLFVDGTIFHQHFRFSDALCDIAESIPCHLVTVLRDPYDTFVSFYFFIQRFSEVFRAAGSTDAKVIGKPIDHPDVLELLRGTFSYHLVLANEWLRANRSIVVRYERLHSDPFAEIRRLTDRIEPVPDESIARAIAATRADHLRNQNDHLKRHIRSAAVGDWRNHLTEDHLEIFRTCHGDLVRALGYDVVEPHSSISLVWEPPSTETPGDPTTPAADAGFSPWDDGAVAHTAGITPASIPIPPLPMRQLVGSTDPSSFDNPTGSLVFPYVDAASYEEVLDFGCGCGRIARQLIQQNPRPRRYEGIDLHRGMIEWCEANLRPLASGFAFHHHDVFNLGFNPGPDKPPFLPFPFPAQQFTLVNAWSVFTHLNEAAAGYYLREVARVLKPNGIFHSTWFLFDKTEFPMMQEFQNALFINDIDPTNAVIFDRAWLRRTAGDAGLVVHFAQPPSVRGFQWILMMTPRREGVTEVDLPPDNAPPGIRRPPVLDRPAHLITAEDRDEV